MWDALDPRSMAHEDNQSEKVEIGKRLALTNMDWDNISATDILQLFNSFCKGDMFIT